MDERSCHAGGRHEVTEAKPSLLARFDTAGFRGFTNLLLAITLTYIVAFGFILVLIFVTVYINTTYLPAARQDPFVSGVLLAGGAVAFMWLISRRRGL